MTIKTTTNRAAIIRSVAILLAGLISVSTSKASACLTMASQNQTISVSMSSGISTELNVVYYTNGEPNDSSGECFASTFIPLSRFPSSSVATRPAELASALREIADLWGATECAVLVHYENDTNEDMTSQELCVKESFKFDKGDYWSSSQEGPCWEPVQSEDFAEFDLEEI